MTSITVHYALGFDQAYGIATEAALKFGETMKVPSFAFDAEEYNHGPNLQLTPNYTVMGRNTPKAPAKAAKLTQTDHIHTDANDHDLGTVVGGDADGVHRGKERGHAAGTR